MRIFQSVSSSFIIGLIAGLGSTSLLYSLNFVIGLRSEHPQFIYGLPFAGLISGLMYEFLSKESHGGTIIILNEIRTSEKIIPLWMAPLVFIGTILTHLFGGSAGREGTAVQMSAALTDNFFQLFKFQSLDRKKILVAALSAGFGSCVGAPWAGALFGLEISTVGKWKFNYWFDCVIASFVGFLTVKILNAPHMIIIPLDKVVYESVVFGCVLFSAVIFGLVSRSFIYFKNIIEVFFKKMIKYQPLRTFVGGIILIFIFYFIDADIYSGLGLNRIQLGLQNISDFEEPLKKFIVTCVTLGSGFKGGEYIPLVFIGTTLGSAMTIFLPIHVGLISALGFVSVFAAASKAPLACTILAIELFGWPIAPYALISCFISVYFSGKSSIYQKAS